MTLISAIGQQVFALFVDDGSLAIAILIWVAIVAGLISVFGVSAIVAGGLLFAGLVAILIENVLRRARQI